MHAPPALCISQLLCHKTDLCDVTSHTDVVCHNIISVDTQMGPILLPQLLMQQVIDQDQYFHEKPQGYDSGVYKTFGNRGEDNCLLIHCAEYWRKLDVKYTKSNIISYYIRAKPEWDMSWSLQSLTNLNSQVPNQYLCGMLNLMSHESRVTLQFRRG